MLKHNYTYSEDVKSGESDSSVDFDLDSATLGIKQSEQ